MIKVYHYPKPEVYNSNETRYDLTDRKDGTIEFVISMVYNDSRKEFSYVLDLSEHVGKVVELVVHESRDVVKIEPFYVYEYADRYINSISEKGAIKVVRAIIDDEMNAYILLCNGHNDIPGFDNVTIDINEHTPSWYLTNDCKWFEEKKNALSKKYMLIRDVDIYDSVSYLESQVDLLTRLVIALSDGKIDEDCLSLLKVADTHSVLDIKSSSSVEKEFTINKANFRKKQEKYYERLS